MSAWQCFSCRHFYSTLLSKKQMRRWSIITLPNITLCSLVCILQVHHSRSIAAVASAAKSALRLRATSRGIDYGMKTAADILVAEIPKFKIPDLTVDIGNFFIVGKAFATKQRVADFKQPTVHYDLATPNQITIKTTGGSAKVEGAWNVVYKIRLIGSHVQASGRFTVTASGMNLLLSANLSLAEHGRVQIDANSCLFDVAKLDTDFSGGVHATIIGLFKGTVKSKIRESFARACAELLSKANAELRKLPTLVDLFSGVRLDISPVSCPHVSATDIEASIRSEISWRGNDDTPFQPYDLPKVSAGNERMVYALASDFILNSLFYAAQEHDLLKKTIDRNTDAEAAAFLRTTCGLGQICAGGLYAPLNRLFPDALIELRIASTAVPECIISPKYISLEAYISIYAYALMPNSSRMLIVSAAVHFEAEVVPRLLMNGTKITFAADFPLLEVSLIKSNIGQFSDMTVTSAVVAGLKPLLTERINDRLAKGFLIPSVANVTITSGKLTLLERAVQFEADVDYDPSLKTASLPPLAQVISGIIPPFM